MHKYLIKMLDETGLKGIVKNVAVKSYERSIALNMQSNKLLPDIQCRARFSHDEKVECIRRARASWEEGINEELQAIATEMKRPFLLIRNEKEVNPLLEANSVQVAPAEGVKFLFDSEDLLETGLAILNDNMNPVFADRYMGQLKLNVPVLELEKMIEKFAELACAEPQLGLDEGYPAVGSRLSVLRHDMGEQLLQSGASMLDARQFLRRGTPPALRARMWRRALGLPEESSMGEEYDFLRLRMECDRLDLLTDELYLHDIQTVVDDPRYFIFEEEMKDAVFCFSRDDWVRQNCHYQVHAPLLGQLSPDLSADTAMPPCAVQPYLGLATYFAPLCYVYKSRASLYAVSRVLWCQLWCRLNVLSSDSNTLLSLCKTFEALLIQVQPRLVLHLVNIGMQPLKIAFPWMQLGFVGILEVDQVILLWDRLLGYMDLNILAVAAAAIFLDRMEPLMKCNSEAEAAVVLMEASRLKIIALMQLMLFRDMRAT